MANAASAGQQRCARANELIVTAARRSSSQQTPFLVVTGKGKSLQRFGFFYLILGHGK